MFRIFQCLYLLCSFVFIHFVLALRIMRWAKRTKLFPLALEVLRIVLSFRFRLQIYKITVICCFESIDVNIEYYYILKHIVLELTRFVQVKLMQTCLLCMISIKWVSHLDCFRHVYLIGRIMIILLFSKFRISFFY